MESLSEEDLAGDLRVALAKISEAYPGYSRKRVQELGSQVLGRSAAGLLFKYEPLGTGADLLDGENALRSVEYMLEAIAGNPAFRNKREEARSAAIALGAFRLFYDELVSDFLKTGGQA